MPELSRSLQDLLGREADYVSRLFDVLVAEHAALEKRDGEALGKAVTEKGALVAELEKLAGERLALLRANGLAADGDGFEALLERSGGDTELSRIWAELRERLEACRTQNRSNGMLIEPSRRGAEEALAVLLGTGDGTCLYDQKGGTGPANVGGRTSFKV